MESGYILHETELVAIIATMESDNKKTGNMIQIWILNREYSPIESVKNGTDKNVCFDCGLRGTDGFKNRKCYVDLAHGPLGIWEKYIAGGYRFLLRAEYSRVFAHRAVRFGAYGDPVLIPLSILRAIASIADGHTGYTHQWRRPEYQAYRAFLMASCDSLGDYATAKRMGWRTFRVRPKGDTTILAREIMCPASDEAGKRTQCIRCKLCSGARAGDGRKDITIIVHGIGKRNFVSLAAIKAAA